MEVTHLAFEEHKVLFEIRDPEDWLQRERASEHTFYEEAMLADIKRRLRPDSLVVDIGANFGNHTLFFAAACKARVVAIEPFPASYDHLLRNIDLNDLSDRVSALNIAIGDRQSRGAFQILDSKHAGTVKVRRGSDAGEVEILPLDELALPGAPDLLKIDVEGAELAVLAGAERTIRAHRPLIYLEALTPLALKKAMAFFAIVDYRLVAGFNRDPTFLFAHRDDPRAHEATGDIAADLAIMVIGHYQFGRQAWEDGYRRAREKERRKLEKEKKKRKKRFSSTRLIRTLIAGLQGRNSQPTAANGEVTGAAGPPVALLDDVLARIVREGRDHRERRQQAWEATGLPFIPLRDQAALRELGGSVAAGLPRVTLLLPTHRPEDLPNIRRTLFSQDYPNIEVVIILNNDRFEPEPIGNELADIPRLKIIQVPEHQPLGACLNQGIPHGTGDYYAKIDGDDLYGPRYVSDMVCTAVRTRADVLGKNRCFHYLSYKNELILRISGRGKVSGGIPGGTLLFTAKVARAVPFITNDLGSEDTAFVLECQKQGFKVVDADPFNYCLIRHRDLSRHTWLPSDQQLFANAERVCHGLRSDIVNV